MSFDIHNLYGCKMFYNITFRVNDNCSVLHPCIPYSAAEDEDREIARVCFTDSIEHCIMAISPGFRDLAVGNLICVRSVDTSFIDKDSVINYVYLHTSGKVPDAMVTHEFWYLKDVPVVSNVYRIDGFNYEYAINYSCISIDDAKRICTQYKTPVRGYTSEQIINCARAYLLDSNLDDAADCLDEDVAALPWAQMLKIYDVKLTQFNL